MYVVIGRIKFWYESCMLEILQCFANVWKISVKFRKFSWNSEFTWKLIFILFRKILKFYEISYKNKPFMKKLENVSILMTKLQKLLKMFRKNYGKFCYIFVKTVHFHRKNGQGWTFPRFNSYLVSSVFFDFRPVGQKYSQIFKKWDTNLDHFKFKLSMIFWKITFNSYINSTDFHFYSSI